MYYIAKESKLKDENWKEKVINNYISAISKCEGVDKNFIEFVKNDENRSKIHINERTTNYFVGSFNIKINYKIQLSSSYSVSDGYKVETEKEMFTNKTKVYLKEQAHSESVSKTDIVSQNISKVFSTREDSLSNEHINIEYFREATIGDIEKANGKNYEKFFQNKLNLLKYDLQLVSNYDDELSKFKVQSKNIASNTGSKVENVKIDSVEVKIPKVKDIDVYMGFCYEIVLNYGEQEYKCYVSLDGNVENPEYLVSNSAKKQASLYRVGCIVKLIFGITTSIVSFIAMLGVLIVSRLILKNALKTLYINEWYATYLTYPFLLFNIAGILFILIFGIMYFSCLFEIIDDLKNKDGKAINTLKTNKKTETIFFIIYFIVILLLIIMSVVQIVGLVQNLTSVLSEIH